MKISIDKPELIQALDVAIKGVSSKSTLSLLEGFLLEAADDSLRITSNDLCIGVQYTAKAEVMKPGKISVNAKLFYDIIKQAPDTEIDMCLSGNELQIEANDITAKVRTASPDSFPGLPNAKGGQMIEVEQKQLKELIGGVLYAAAPEGDQRPYLVSVLLDSENGVLTAVAIDGFRMSIRRSKVEDTNFTVLLPLKAASEITKVMKSGKVRLYNNRHAAMIETENFIMTSDLVGGEFMNYKSMLSHETNISATVDTKELIAALEMIDLFIRREEPVRRPPMQLSIMNDGIEVSCTTSVGKSKNLIKCETNGEVNISINNRYLLEALHQVDDPKLRLEFTSELAPLRIKPVEGNKFFHLILPVRKRFNRLKEA